MVQEGARGSKAEGGRRKGEGSANGRRLPRQRALPLPPSALRLRLSGVRSPGSRRRAGRWDCRWRSRGPSDRRGSRSWCRPGAGRSSSASPRPRRAAHSGRRSSGSKAVSNPKEYCRPAQPPPATPMRSTAPSSTLCSPITFDFRGRRLGQCDCHEKNGPRCQIERVGKLSMVGLRSARRTLLLLSYQCRRPAGKRSCHGCVSRAEGQPKGTVPFSGPTLRVAARKLEQCPAVATTPLSCHAAVLSATGRPPRRRGR